MKKNLFDAMKKQTEQMLGSKPLDLLSISEGESKDKETGDIKKYVRLEVEVPRGHGDFSRCRFSVKIPEGKMLVNDESLEKAGFLVVFKNLSISYIDDRNTVYFRADDYSVKKEDV